jgi:hypothetical protein
MAEPLLFLEELPDEVTATIETRERALAALGSASGGLEFVVQRLQRWLPGSTVRVAFLGGDAELHADIAQLAGTIGEHGNLVLDFGFDANTGNYRTWSEDDDEYGAEIRVSFDQGGFFSLVGTDSIAEDIGPPSGKVGGRPGQRSLNLGGFHIQRPASWKGTVLHEFLHALSFHHEHANFRGPCQLAFRWEDDSDYVPTTDSRGVFVPDPAGRRPGIYTYLAGAPNFWSRAKVDHNLKEVRGPGIEASEFDRASVMLYRFPTLFYRTANSDCAPSGDGQSLSDGDQSGLRSLYPSETDASEDIAEGKRSLLGELTSRDAASGAELESMGTSRAGRSRALAPSVDCLKRQLAGRY